MQMQTLLYINCLAANLSCSFIEPGTTLPYIGAVITPLSVPVLILLSTNGTDN